MKTPQLLILLLTIMVQVGDGFPTNMRALPGQDKYASWDDVNVVAHGLLQLGQGLKEHVDKTKAQMRDINGKLKSFNATVAELERKQREQDETMTVRNKEVEDRERMVAELAKEVMGKMEEMKKQNEDVNSRMDRLEEKMVGVQLVDSYNNDHTGVPLVQRLVLHQNRRIDQLVEKIKQQQDKLEKQSLHMQTLQNKVAQKRVKSQRRRDGETTLRGEVAQNENPSGLARDCHDLFEQGERTSGVYTIQPESWQPFNVLCEMTTEGGWTIIQKRHDGSQNFDLQWENYKRGFGSLNGEFWLGLENIWSLSKQGQYILQVELSDWAGQQQPPARYLFQLDGEEKKFTLHLEDDSPSGVQETLLSTGASGVAFSTADADNDLAADVNCADLLSGGWWFGSCGESNLNGRYLRGARRHPSKRRGMFWTSSKGQRTSVKTSLLKIAPASIKQ